MCCAHPQEVPRRGLHAAHPAEGSQTIVLEQDGAECMQSLALGFRKLAYGIMKIALSHFLILIRLAWELVNEGAHCLEVGLSAFKLILRQGRDSY